MRKMTELALTVSVVFYSFTDTPNAKAKHGYDRKFNPNHPGAVFGLASEWRSYSGEFTVPPNERCSLAFSKADADAKMELDDVTAVAVEE